MGRLNCSPNYALIYAGSGADYTGNFAQLPVNDRCLGVVVAKRW
jgi:hypothetical protein